MTLEADGYITIYEIETGNVVAQYEGLGVHAAILELAILRRQVAALQAARKRSGESFADEVRRQIETEGEQAP